MAYQNNILNILSQIIGAAGGLASPIGVYFAFQSAIRRRGRKRIQRFIQLAVVGMIAFLFGLALRR